MNLNTVFICHNNEYLAGIIQVYIYFYYSESRPENFNHKFLIL